MKATTRGWCSVSASVRSGGTLRLGRSAGIMVDGTCALRTRSSICSSSSSSSPVLHLRRNLSLLLVQGRSGITSSSSSRLHPATAARQPESRFSFTTESSADAAAASQASAATSGADAAAQEGAPSADDVQLIYDAPKKGILRGLKLFSLTTCFASLAGTPILVTFGNPDVPLLGRSALGLTALFFGVSTTALLNHLTKGYVTKAYLSTPAALVNANASSAPSTQQHHEGQQEQEPARQKLILHTYNLLTRTRREEVDVDDIHAPQTIMPYVTFHSERNRKNYCLEYTAFEDKDLWHELFPFANRE